MGDRVAVLNGGQIEQCDRPRDLYDRPANLFVAAFIGSPSMNFFSATVERRDAGLAAVMGSTSMLPLDLSTLTDDIGEWIGRNDHRRRARRIGHRRSTPRRLAAAHRHRRVRRGARLRGDRARPRRPGSVRRSTSAWRRSARADDREIAPTVSNLVTKLPAHSACRPGDTVTLYIDPANVHCFDPAGPSLRKGADQ